MLNDNREPPSLMKKSPPSGGLNAKQKAHQALQASPLLEPLKARIHIHLLV